MPNCLRWPLGNVRKVWLKSWIKEVFRSLLLISVIDSCHFPSWSKLLKAYSFKDQGKRRGGVTSLTNKSLVVRWDIYVQNTSSSWGDLNPNYPLPRRLHLKLGSVLEPWRLGSPLIFLFKAVMLRMKYVDVH